MLRHPITCLTICIRVDAFERYQAATNAVFDGDVGLLKITNPEFVNIKSLFYIINGVTFEFTADAQIWPVCLYQCFLS